MSKEIDIKIKNQVENIYNAIKDDLPIDVDDARRILCENGNYWIDDDMMDESLYRFCCGRTGEKYKKSNPLDCKKMVIAQAFADDEIDKIVSAHTVTINDFDVFYPSARKYMRYEIFTK